MCCGSHQKPGPPGYLEPDAAHDDVEAATEEERCKCLGQWFPAHRITECICMHKMTGEDLRCDTCRAYCAIECTPRVMSEAALAAQR
jgi:hypothetical protein